MLAETAVILLWVIASVATALAVEGTGALTYRAPLYFICMVGSVLVVRKAKER